MVFRSLLEHFGDAGGKRFFLNRGVFFGGHVFLSSRHDGSHAFSRSVVHNAFISRSSSSPVFGSRYRRGERDGPNEVETQSVHVAPFSPISRVTIYGRCRLIQLLARATDKSEEEKREICLERSREIFTKPSPQLLLISLLIKLPCHQNTAHFSTSNRSLPKI